MSGKVVIKANDHKIDYKCTVIKGGELAQMAARSTSDWKIPSSNPAGSNDNSNQYMQRIAKFKFKFKHLNQPPSLEFGVRVN